MKRIKLLTALLVVCMMLTSFTAYAIDGEDTTAEATTTEQTTEAVTEPTTDEETEVTTEPQTKEETTEDDFDASEFDAPRPKPSRWNLTTTSSRPPKTTQKREPVRDEEVGNGNNADNNNDTPVVVIPEDTTLPEGQFYVYLEKNNGTKRLKTLLKEPSLVSEPEIPVRNGFVFDGWYADSKFTKKWNFFTDIAQEGTVIYAKWVKDPNAVVYAITVKSVSGGYLEVNPDTATKGEPIVITAYPDDNMRLVAGSVLVNGKATDVLNFIMPGKDVVIEAQFEKIPERNEDESKISPIPFIIGGIVLLVAIVAIVLFIRSRQDDFSEDEIDENGTIIDLELDDKSWVDESIVVEDGFKDGEKVIGNYTPEADDFAEDPFEDLE